MGLPSPRKSTNESPARGTKTLNNYFSTSPSKKRAASAAVIVDLENLSNGSDRREPRAAAIGIGTAESPLQIDDMGFETVSALVRIKSSNDVPKKLKYMAGDDGVFLLFKGGIFGRDLAAIKEPSPRQLKGKKIHLGIVCSGSSGVSRKQLQITKLSPLTVKQFSKATNEVAVLRYNPLLKTMGKRADYLGKGKYTTLKPGDAIEMDRLAKRGRDMPPDHVFRVVDCVVRKQMESDKKRPVLMAPSPKDRIDLVESRTLMSPRKRPFARTSTSSPKDAIDLMDSQPMTNRKKRLFFVAAAAASPPVMYDLVGSSAEPSNHTNRSESRKSMESVATKHYPKSAKDSHKKEIIIALHDTKRSSQSSSTTTPKQVAKKGAHAKPSGVAKLEAAAKKPAKKAPQFEVKATTSPKKSLKKLRSKHLKSAAPRIVQSDATVVETENCRKVVRSNSAPDLLPQVGDQFRVLFSSTDAFKQQREAWWYATAIKVVHEEGHIFPGEKRYSVTLVFRDQSQSDYVYPDEEVQRLEPVVGSSTMHALVHTQSEVTKEVAFDMNPQSLALGDLVDAYYQNGVENCRWYRGRIAAVDAETNTCTILYEDEDMESGVPIGQKKIVLVDKGDRATWLEGLAVWDDFRTEKAASTRKKRIWKKIGYVSEIVREGDDNSVILELVVRGKVKEERIKYTDFVSYLFDSIISNYASIKVWPGAQIAPKKRSRTIKKRIVVKEEISEDTARDIPAKAESRKVRQEVTQKKSQPKDNPEEGMATMKSKKRLPKIKEEFKEEEWDISKETVKLEFKTEPDTMIEMQQPLSSAYFRALNSSDPLVGLDLLIQTATFGKRGMNPNIGSSIRELLINGPSSEGTLFPDAHRIEAMLRYLDILTKLEGGNDNFSKSCGVDDWSALHGIMEKILEPRYLYEGDEGSKDADALDRMISSIHLSASVASFLSMLLMAELGGQVRSAKPDKSQCRQGPLAQAMLNNSNGIRNSVKAMVRICVSSWLRYGHYLLSDTTLAPGMRRCRHETKTMLKNLGSVISQVLWIYSVCEGIQINDLDLAVLFKEVYDLETSRGVFDPADYMARKKMPAAYWKKLKLRLILSLDEEIVAPVQGNLAGKFDVAKEYNCVIE